MDKLNIKKLRAVIAGYTQPSTAVALLIFMTDILVYSAAITGVIFLENIWLRIMCSLLAGFLISLLFIVAHDAAHDSFTASTRLNRLIARMSFFPSLHNYSLWLIAHNRLHHQLTNLKGANSWSPLSREEYLAMPAWRQGIERFYRCPAGIGFNYLIERWWKNKFFPYKRITGNRRTSAWTDFFLIIGWLVLFLAMLVYAGGVLKHTGPVELVILGFFIPLLYASYMIGISVYLQHTHETIPWFKTKEETREKGKYEEITMYVRFPAWYRLLTHNVMEHTAHHIDPRVPLYRLAKAQEALVGVIGEKTVTVPFSLKGLLRTMARCKLYDYKHHCWLDFTGHPTSKLHLAGDDVGYQHAPA